MHCSIEELIFRRRNLENDKALINCFPFYAYGAFFVGIALSAIVLYICNKVPML
jgi:hypothetical protein